MKLNFNKLHNTRDLGGMRAVDGRMIRHGLLLRSGQLSDIDQSDTERLQSLVRTVIDFRTDGERAENPDTSIPGVQNIHVPIVDSLTAGISREKEADRDLFQSLLLKPQEARSYMCGMYRAFTDAFSVRQYARFIRMLTDAEGGVLWHCTAGKDRAGIASAIVEEILGIPREEIIADYMATGEYLSADIQFLTEFVKRQAGTTSGLADEALEYLFGVKREYINSFYDSVAEKYGSFKGFLHDALLVSDEMVTCMRDKYLEQ